jgi:hypothetical protein
MTSDSSMLAITCSRPWQRTRASISIANTRIASGSASQRYVDPSMSVHRNVTVPDGRTPPPEDMPEDPTVAADLSEPPNDSGRPALTNAGAAPDLERQRQALGPTKEHK